LLAVVTMSNAVLRISFSNWDCISCELL